MQRQAGSPHHLFAGQHLLDAGEVVQPGPTFMAIAGSRLIFFLSKTISLMSSASSLLHHSALNIKVDILINFRISCMCSSSHLQHLAVQWEAFIGLDIHEYGEVICIEWCNSN